MRIMVMGAGSIGSLFGGRLADAGNDVVLVGRERHVEAVRRGGLVIRGISDRVVKVEAVTSLREAEGPFDLIVLTVKAYDTREAARDVRGLVDGETSLLCLQNGLGTEELAAESVKAPLRGVTMNGALLSEDGVVTQTGWGETVIGELDGSCTRRVKAVADVFSEAGLQTEVSRDIGSVVWAKTLVNSAINPLGALTSLRNGELLRVPSLRGLMTRTVKEGVAVAEKIGVNLVEDPVSLAIRTAELTADNKNSMLQDVLKRRRTEIDFINGAVSVHGQRIGVPTPINDVLTSLIKGLEQGNEKPENV